MLKPESPSHTGWGRAAAMRFAKTEEEIKAEIIKALEGKLSVEFQDYSQWQRVSTEGSVTSHPSTKTTLKPKSLLSATSTSKQTTVSSGCSSLCLHPWNKKDPPVDRTAEIEKNNRIAILKAQIASTKQSLLEYMKLQKMLKVTNQSLKDEIVGTEENTHKQVTELLEKFEKYSSASKVLADNHRSDVMKLAVDYKKTKTDINDQLEKLQKDASIINDKLLENEEELQMLRTYKDKVYPERALTIARLQSDIHTVSQEQKEQEKDLDRIIQGERNAVASNYNANAIKIVESAAEKALQSTSISLDDIKASNMSLMREIEEQQTEILRLESEILELKTDIDALKKMEESNMHKFVFPEIFPERKICDPDEDIVLDIPVRQFLPI